MTTYEKIDRWITQHENFKYCERTLDSVADYVAWAWKWKKITREQMESAADRVCALYDAKFEKTIDRNYDGWES